jgi:hypothetical protein
LQVISIAESADKELFVYVYQPSANHKATSISFSTQKKGKDFNMYYLKYINKFKGLYKYAVKDFEVAGDETRYYEIASIFRAYDPNVDQAPAPGQTISEVSFAVGKQYILTNEDTICYDVETIEITDKYVGFVRYENPGSWIEYSCDRHFVAFNTNKKVDKIIEADIFYKTQAVYTNRLDINYAPFAYEFGEIEQCNTHLSLYDDEVKITVSNSGLLGNKRYLTYSWNGIETVSQFINSVNVEKTYTAGIFNVEVSSKITPDALLVLDNKQWVLSFDATDYTFQHNPKGTGGDEWFTIVSEVSILRLQFETDGRVYNLGVVDNFQSGDKNPVNVTTKNVILNWLLFSLLFIFCAVMLLLIFAPQILLLILKFIWKCICALFKGLWWLITLPLEIFTKEDKNA